MKLIDKSALVAEINRLYKEHSDSRYGCDEAALCLEVLENFIDTLEVIEIGVDIGSPEGGVGVKTIWDGNKMVSDKAQKGEEI